MIYQDLFTHRVYVALPLAAVLAELPPEVLITRIPLGAFVMPLEEQNGVHFIDERALTAIILASGGPHAARRALGLEELVQGVRGRHVADPAAFGRAVEAHVITMLAQAMRVAPALVMDEMQRRGFAVLDEVRRHLVPEHGPAPACPRSPN